MLGQVPGGLQPPGIFLCLRSHADLVMLRTILICAFGGAMGIRDAYLGAYKRAHGKTIVKGAALSDLVKAKAPAADAELHKLLSEARDKMTVMKKPAASGEMAYDQMIGEDNPKGNAIVQAAIDALLAQTRGTEKVVETLGLGAVAFEGSDSLDEPQKVFK